MGLDDEERPVAVELWDDDVGLDETAVDVAADERGVGQLAHFGEHNLVALLGLLEALAAGLRIGAKLRLDVGPHGGQPLRSEVLKVLPIPRAEVLQAAQALLE